MLPSLMGIFFLTMGQASGAQEASHGAASEEAATLVGEAKALSQEALEQAKKMLEAAPPTDQQAKAQKILGDGALRRGRVCRGAAPWEEDAASGESPCLSHTSESKPSSPQLSVLVSFSMPERALKELFVQVQKAGGRLVVRGLLEDSFAKTKLKVQTLGIHVDVDPHLFERFNVKAVPFFVLQRAPHTHTLQGNVRVAFALEQMRRSS